MDEIWLLAGSEAYGLIGCTRLLGAVTAGGNGVVLLGKPRNQTWVDHSIEAGTCANAIAELRCQEGGIPPVLHEQREDLPMPERNPDFAGWTTFA